MSLLPIIYMSLMIATGFLTFVILISYISYKVKQRGRAGIPAMRKINYDQEMRMRGIAKPAPKVTTRNIQSSNRNQTNRNQPVNIEKPSVHKMPKPQHPVSKRPVQTDQQPKVRKQVSRNKSTAYPETKPDFMKKTASGKFKNRIEVINQIRNSEPSTEVEYNSDIHSHSNRKLNSNDVLDFYDDDGTEYFTLRSAGIA